jgi:outer membrane immunogenic protein
MHKRTNKRQFKRISTFAASHKITDVIGLQQTCALQWCTNLSNKTSDTWGLTLKEMLLAGIALGILAAPALAADMAVKAPAPYPYLWNGFYGGLNVGYADEQSTFTTAAVPPTPDPFFDGLAVLSSGRIATGNGMGVIGGGQVGYNMQLTKLWMVGLEADIQGKTGTSGGSIAAGQAVLGFPITSTQTVSAKTDWIGTVRGRFGIVLTPTWLVYFTAGLAYGGNNANTTLNQGGPLPGGFVGTGAGSISDTRIGGTYGAGLEWMFARNWSAKAEYLFYDLGTATFSYPVKSSAFAAPYQTLSNSVHFEGNIARVGLNYHF